METRGCLSHCQEPGGTDEKQGKTHRQIGVNVILFRFMHGALTLFFLSAFTLLLPLFTYFD